MHTFPYCKEDRKIDVFGFKRWVFKAIVSTSLIHIVESHSASAPDQALTSLHHACANIFLATINATKYLQKLKIPSLFLEEANITVFQYQLNFKKD